jgi:hemolysin activation/secretion protein
LLNNEGNFHQFVLDARHYKQLWKENVFAVQLFGTWNSGNVPFRMMGTLGNENFYRGYYQGRYRDHHAVALQAELRKTVWGPLGMAAFGGVATVARTTTDLFSSIKPALGAGLRFKGIPRERINLRIDYAIGIERSRTVYITVNEAF